MNSAKSKTKSSVWVVEKGKVRSRPDQLATEEPLEIRLTSPQKTIAVTMRTPGADFDLVVGFLYSEGIIKSREDIRHMSYCVDPEVDGEQRQNIVNVTLQPNLTLNLRSLERHFFTSSACGVCGKTSIESLQMRGCSTIESDLSLNPDIFYSLPQKLQSAQALFGATGGLHAAALFTSTGELVKLREDVGRHNALDKLVGSAILTAEFPLTHYIVMVSGRSSFEILQKCIVANVPIVCAVSAPSSLAVAIAQAFNITLIGFLRGERFNVYAGIERIQSVF